MKVLLIGHACGPGLGSEPGNTWEFASRLSEHHQVWLIAHPEHRDRVERSLAERPNPNLRIAWVTTRTRFDPWKPEQGESGIRLHYVLWLREAYREAQRLHRETGFDVAHHVSWGTVGAAPPLWKIAAPTVWGPLGGGQTTPEAFLPYFEADARKERLRNLYTRLLRHSPSLRHAVRSAGLVLATNRETSDLLRRAGARNVRLFLDCGLFQEPAPPSARPSTSTENRIFLWAGRLEHRKGLLVALEAFSRIGRDLPVKLLIAGKGPLRERCEEKAHSLGLDGKVEFLGPVPYERMPQIFQSADAFLFTSLRDSFGSVVLEAMSYGLPVIALNHQGVGAFVPESAGAKIAVTRPWEVIESLALAIEKISRCAACRARMGAAAWEQARQETWERRVSRLMAAYEEVITADRRV
ncbi:MAG: glycosyltransferase [Bryobacteraceae bacterium]